MGSSSNGDLFDGSSNKRSLYSGYCTSSGVSLKYKKRKVYAVRDFPHGCGQNASFINLMPQDTDVVASLGDKENLVADEKMVKVAEGDCVKASEIGNESSSHQLVESPVKLELPDILNDLLGKVVVAAGKVNGAELSPVVESLGSGLPKALENNALELSKELHEVEVQAVLKSEGAPESKIVLEIVSMADGRVPSGGAKTWFPPEWPTSDGNVSKETNLKAKYFRRRVRAIREFPPFCGMNAICPTEEECLRIVLGNKASVAPVEAALQGTLSRETVRAKEECSLVRKTARTGIEELDRDVRDTNAKNRDMKKKLLPSGKASYEIKGAQVVKDKGDFSICEQDEDSPASQRPHDFQVILPPFGPDSSSHGNVRSKVRETQRLFQAICRKLLQGEEANLKKQGYLSRRLDLKAAQIIRAKGKEVNIGKQIIGSVPGVDVGDQFQYRVELALVGIHRLYQAGIDYMKHGGMIIATSIVASGGYADDLDNPDVLIYSGHGGNITGRNKQQPEDQKLERGNLALKNSISAKNLVRVIRGSKETKLSTLDARGKIVLTYTYDGLYTVERYMHDVGPHGKLVFKFELKRIPGQPELAWKEVKKSKRFKIREGLCVGDISGGKELFPICAVNTIDNKRPPKFNYVTEMKYPDWYCPTAPKGCDCIGGCLDSKKCSCMFNNGGKIPYNCNGAIVDAKPLVYECGPSCKCPPSCYNKVSQHGMKIQLEIFKTKSKGWGVRSLTSIPSGSFICEYIGELLEGKEAEKEQNDEYLFDIGHNFSDCSLIGGLLTLKPVVQLSSSEVVEDERFTINAAECGNVGRFINHSCSPNLYAQNVLYDHEDKSKPHIMLFAAENIPPLKELTYHYNYFIDQVRDLNGNIKMKSCYCGAAECTGRMY
ncbi:hypothetical protein CsSME_00035897 [Camellia sinensis var. sinensis]